MTKYSNTPKVMHGGSKEKLYWVYRGIIKRCRLPSDKAYGIYGERGIDICNTWLEDYSIFREWAITNGYQEGLSIDRIDNDAGYNPANCRWVDRKIQNRNKSNTKFLKFNGITKTLADWADFTGIPLKTLRNRMVRGLGAKEILERQYTKKARAA